MASEISLESLGLTEDALVEKLVDRLAENLLTSLRYDEGGDEWYGESAFAQKLDAMAKARLNEIVTKLGEEHVVPRVNEMVDNLILQETNKWGEAKGSKALTVREYFVERAEAWICEQVNYDGKPKSRDSYNWRASSTRLAYMIDKHLHHEIERAMTAALSQANTSIAKSLHEAVRLAINEVAGKLQVSVKTGR